LNSSRSNVAALLNGLAGESVSYLAQHHSLTRVLAQRKTAHTMTMIPSAPDTNSMSCTGIDDSQLDVIRPTLRAQG
jgi:hypothetical protein